MLWRLCRNLFSDCQCWVHSEYGYKLLVLVPLTVWEKPSKSMFLMIFYYIVVRMPLAYLLSYLGFGLNGIWVAVLVSHVVASVAAGISGTIAIKKRTSTT